MRPSPRHRPTPNPPRQADAARQNTAGCFRATPAAHRMDNCCSRMIGNRPVRMTRVAAVVDHACATARKQRSCSSAGARRMTSSASIAATAHSARPGQQSITIVRRFDGGSGILCASCSKSNSVGRLNGRAGPVQPEFARRKSAPPLFRKRRNRSTRKSAKSRCGCSAPGSNVRSRRAHSSQAGNPGPKPARARSVTAAAWSRPIEKTDRA